MSLLVEMRGISKSFGGAPALQDVDLDLGAGEVLALLGANGAGKSTLVRILCGVYGKDRGSIRLDGKESALSGPEEALGRGVRFLPQEVSVLPDLSVAENILIADLPLRRTLGIALVDRAAMRKKAGELLSRLGLALDPDRHVSLLSAPEQRLVEIARALAGKARIIVMDEPTAALAEPEAQALFRIIARLKEEGIGVIYISHYLDEVFRIADRVAVLRDGRNAGVFVAATATRREVLEAMLGQAMDALYPPVGKLEGDTALAVDIPNDIPPNDVALAVEDMHVSGSLYGVSFEMRGGEILGIFGLIGSGIAEVGRALYGALGPLPHGRVRVAGRTYAPSHPRRARDLGIGFVAAERQREGIIPDLGVGANISLPFIERFLQLGGVCRQRELKHAQSWIERLGIRTPSAAQPVRLLSGGNQQKVCLARWLSEGVNVLILEEPTRGVDLGARRELYLELRRWTARGLAALVVSSDAEEVAGLCDRSLVLDRGRVAVRFGPGVSAAQLMEVPGSSEQTS